VVLYGANREGWLLARAEVGMDPENVPGRVFADTRDLAVGTVAVGYRKWLTPDYGVSGELETFGQIETWGRFGITASLFAAF
jgi:hypothetical protein